MKNIGELFILGFHGPKIPEWLKEFASRFSLGGVILFDYYVQTKKYENNIYSPEQVKELCAEIAALPSHPLVFIDQEGGKVRRLKEKLGFAPYPSQQKFVALPETEKREILEKVYQELKDLGINVNMSPVVDLNTNPANPNIGAVERSFSADPKIVEENAKLVASVARKYKIGLTLKHFPGLGGATVDSHEELTDLTKTVSQEQLTVFRELFSVIDSKAVVMSHGLVKDWDAQFPVSLSEAAVNIIRTWDKDALLITDDLQMQGLQKLYPTGDACVHALNAGLDMFCIGNNLMNQEKECLGYAEKLTALTDARSLANSKVAINRVQNWKKQLH